MPDDQVLALHPNEVVLVRLGAATGLVVPATQYASLVTFALTSRPHMNALEVQTARQAKILGGVLVR